MPSYAKGTEVTPERTRAEIERTVARYGPAWYDGEAWYSWKDGPKLRSAPSHCMLPEAPTGV